MKKILLSFLIATDLFAGFPHSDVTSIPADKTWQIQEKDFWELIKYVNDIYKPIFANVKTPQGETVSAWINGYWYDKQGNIDSKKEKVPPYNWNKWTIEVYGGLARHPFMTKDAFMLAICHQIGHFLGGAPLQDYLTISTEGQADYYATHVCARKIFGKMEKQRKLIKLGVKLDQCDKYFDSEYEINVCYRTLFAAQALSEWIKVAAGERRDTDININDNYEPKYTIQLHSSAQCRLDGFVSGHFCDKPWDDTKIPLNRNAVCRNRPKCWYKS